MAASYISVPRDLTKVKSKVMFNLTKRQLICFGMAVLIGVPSFFLMKTVMKTNTAVMGMMVIMMPFFFLAMYEKNGQPLEVILNHMIAPGRLPAAAEGCSERRVPASRPGRPCIEKGVRAGCTYTLFDFTRHAVRRRTGQVKLIRYS